jgi:hypothetical protein
MLLKFFYPPICGHEAQNVCAVGGLIHAIGMGDGYYMGLSVQDRQMMLACASTLLSHSPSQFHLPLIDMPVCSRARSRPDFLRVTGFRPVCVPLLAWNLAESLVYWTDLDEKNANCV